MFKVPLSELKEKIKTEVHITEEELDTKIKVKVNELSGLISEEGAAHIIANELGIKLINEEGRLKIKGIYSGMRDIEVIGKVVNKFDVKEFSKGDRQGKVGSFILGDETGTIRIVCWNDQAENINKINQGDIILIKSGYAKENNFNQKEIHFNERTKIEINPNGESVGEVKQGLSHQRKKINELRDGETGIEVLGTVVQIFDPRFFSVCPECNKRVMEKEGGFYCNAHNQVTPEHSYVLNLVLDDGTGTIRTVFWKNQTNHLLGKKEEEIAVYKNDLNSFEDIKTELLGEQFQIVGRVNRNEMFDRLEFVAQLVNKAEPEEEIKRLES